MNLFGVLGVIFIVLKLVGVVSWPWLWVLAPLWAPLAVYLLVMLCIGIGTVVAVVGSKVLR